MAGKDVAAPLLSGEPAAPLPHERRNWVMCLAIAVGAISVSAWLLASSGPPELVERATGPTECVFHIAACLMQLSALLALLFDPDPLVVDYAVSGQPQIPSVQCEFLGFRKWVTFTVWSNTLCALYFALATAYDVFALEGSQVPPALSSTLTVVWSIIFPMSFLVNIVVSFVLYPDMYSQGKFVKLWYVLNWRGHTLHNGFVILASVEAALVTPPIALQYFPIAMVYGVVYVLFAWVNYFRNRVYVYFFLDPRFKKAPVAIIGLMVFLVLLFLAGSVALSASRKHWWVKALVIVIALATCTWKDPPFAKKGEHVRGVGTLRAILRLCRSSESGE